MKHFFILLLITKSLSMFCNYYPLNEKACIQKTTGISCQFNFFQNACIETKSTRLGCASNLNLDACLQQRTNGQEEVKCYFSQKCQAANPFHLKMLDCDQYFSFSGCMNLVEKQCAWMNNRCLTYNQDILEKDSCSEVFSSPASPLLCARIPGLKCYNNGYIGGYTCSDVSDTALTELRCDALGLSEAACVSILTKGQRCLFQNSKCQLYTNQMISKCEVFFNKELCLSINDPSILCQWSNRGCQPLTSSNECDGLKNINPSVCQKANGQCLYNQQNNSCEVVVKGDDLKCDNIGLSEEACMKIKKYKCIFEGRCKSLTDEELHLFNCDQVLNELACISIRTPFQFCKWDGVKCSRILINQDIECPLIQQYHVNGNTCQAISKYNQGCKYNSQTNLCQANQSATDSCTTGFLNLSGCVQVQSNIACKWDTETFSCKEVKVIDQLTKCSELGFANAIACSQVSEPITITNGVIIKLGCYYDQETQTCKYTSNNNLQSMECSQPGLNKYGCTQIIKLGQRCRWIRGVCTSIIKKEYLALTPCLDLQYVNAGACALVTANSEVCKYNINAMGCVNTINTSIDGDSCSTPGLNSFACSQITRDSNGCYFDKINNVCYVAPNSYSSDKAEKYASALLLSTVQCVSSSPTRNICITILTNGQLCSWNTRSNQCENQYVEFNEKCLDYNTAERQKTVNGAIINVNANVCASILMNYPDDKPQTLLKTADYLRGYCQFDGRGNCMIYAVKPCTDPCCTQVLGINAHVCSRFTDQKSYCYFNENNKCVELTSSDTDITSASSVKAFYNFKQYKCSSMNSKSCTMIEWSTKQQCFWNGQVCTQVNYNDYSNFIVFTLGIVISKYGCLGIQANTNNIIKYFRYYPDSQLCLSDPGIMLQCNQFLGNQNKCLGLTPNIYCQWDKFSMQCLPIDNYLNLMTCNEYQNKQACIDNPYVPCLFLESADKCISSPSEVNCADFGLPSNDYYGWVNEKACQNITKAGQICEFSFNRCIFSYKQPSTSCDLPGINSIGCYSKTTGHCRWNSVQLLCYEVDSSMIDTLKCTDNVNKQICLQIVIYPCEWNKTDLKCANKASFNSVNINNLFNAQTCTQMIGAAYYYDDTTQICKILTTTNNDCTTKIMNQQACLLNTKGNKCYFDSNQVPEKKCQQFNQEQEVCQSNILINIEICMNLPQTCYFDESTFTCFSVALNPQMKCSSLISDTIHFNKLSCSSISSSITDSSSDAQLQVCIKTPSVLGAAQQCYFEKYCYWDEIVYGCKLYNIVKEQFSLGNQNSPATCSLTQITIPSCSPIYSAAVCLQFGNNCFFDILQGGCKPYIPNSYKVYECSQINGEQCTDSKTNTAYCIPEILGVDLTDNCSIDPPITSICIRDPNYIKPSCSSLSSSSKASDCALASDDCFLKSKCTIPTSSDKVNCTTAGVSKSLCLSLNPPCDFSSGLCTDLTIPSLDSFNYYYVCNEANLLTTNHSDIVCGSITTSPCKYSSFTCGNAFYQTCSSLSGLIVSQQACNQCSGSGSIYNPDTYQCEIVTNLTTDCDSISDQMFCQAKTKLCQWDSENKNCHVNTLRLNKISCLQLTQTIMTKWNNNQCVSLDNSTVQQETDCTIQSIKSCLIIANTCWVSNSTNQCVKLNQLIKNCQDINEAKGTQNQCLISALEACQWKNNKCENANLTSDGCAVMNKYGCLNIQQNITCGWSDKDKKCKQINLDNNEGCANYVNGNDANYYQVNPYSCTLIQNANCYWNQDTNKCISVGATSLSCSKNIGINKNACIQSTEGKCKFDTTSSTCVEITSSDTACSSLMNMEACLSLNYCQFAKNECSNYPYQAKTSIDLAKAIPDGVISPYICTYYNNNLKNAFFIYDEKRKYCLNANLDSPSLYFAQCSSIGVNEAICKQKTNQYCNVLFFILGQYVNSQCTEITLDQIKSETICNSTFNWKSCLKLQVNCKFINGSCVSIAQTDTCISLTVPLLALVPVLVSSKICAQMKSACQYNPLTYNCQLVLDIYSECSTEGISQLGCLQYTKKSLCFYDAVNYTCSDNYDRKLTCSDTDTPDNWFINENLCYFVNSVGSYCQFKDGFCQQLSDVQVKQTCYLASQTNARTCSKGEKSICFYLPETKFCSPLLVLLQLQPWTNNSSFNKLACISYDNPNDQRKTIWDEVEGCLELSTADLTNIQCSSPVNRLGCISITNPTQFCQYNLLINKCIGYDYIIPPSTPIAICVLLANVNRLEFCQYAPDSCQYNGLTKNCVIATITDTQIVTPSDCFDKGLSKVACTNLSQCKYSDARKLCYGGNVFCSDNTPQTCSNVKTEPCWVVNNACVGISYTDLVTVRCSDVVNQLGCTSISTPSVVCQFDQVTSICQEILNFTNNCSSYKNVNSALACEQTIDEACKFDYSSKSCKAVQFSDVFECNRGLNQLACTEYTRSSLGCKFGKFCYGPTFGVTQCSDIINIATCMNYKFQCTWNSNLCVDFTLKSETCLDLQNNQTIVSSQVCYHSQVNQGVCIYNINTNNCKFIIPKACQELETQQQCISQKNLPCLWANDRCSFITILSTDRCQQIGENGTKRACMDVFRQGEKCQYMDNKCQSLLETTQGCFDSINQIACVQQLTSQCQWKTTTTTVMANLKDEITYNYGVCVDYVINKQQSCDKSLSYASCFTITKIGQFCRWLNGECMPIPQSQSNIYYNTYTLVNSNACGLVNQGKVKYSEYTKSCILIPENTQDLTCQCGEETPGINKYACLSIKNQSCLWDEVTKKCLEYQSACHKNRLLQQSNCFTGNAKPEDCQQISQPCSYQNETCIDIDLNFAKCDHQGINQFACKLMASKGCSWDKNGKTCQYHEKQAIISISLSQTIIFITILMVIYG